eukprot:g19377.t1
MLLSFSVWHHSEALLRAGPARAKELQDPPGHRGREATRFEAWVPNSLPPRVHAGARKFPEVPVTGRRNA